jgi:hypothetical protein
MVFMDANTVAGLAISGMKRRRNVRERTSSPANAL